MIYNSNDIIELRKKYIELNTGFKNTFIYPLTNRGFYSEINNLGLIAIYCLENKIQLKIDTNNWQSGKWTDYFNPILTSYNGIIPIPNSCVFGLNRKEKIYALIHSLIFNRDIIQNGIWNSMRSDSFLNKKFNFKTLNIINNSIFDTKRKIMKILFDLNDSSKKIVLDTFKLQSIPFENSISFHIRRGDKVLGNNKEAKIIDLKTYMDKVLEINPKPNLIIICTDDYLTLKELKSNYPEYTFHSFCDPDAKGYDQKNYNSLKVDYKKKAVYDLLLDTYIMLNTTYFIGIYASNLSRFIVLMRNNKESYSVDVDWYAL